VLVCIGILDVDALETGVIDLAAHYSRSVGVPRFAG